MEHQELVALEHMRAALATAYVEAITGHATRMDARASMNSLELRELARQGHIKAASVRVFAATNLGRAQRMDAMELTESVLLASITDVLATTNVEI
jgi:hypothetical protein